MTELLVVIAIICILASLIFTGVQRTRQTALTITCMNTMRQWTVAFPLYAADHNGYLPTANLTLATQSNWQQSIAPYVTGITTQYAYSTLRTRYHCPGDTAASTGWCYSTNLNLITPIAGSPFIVRRFSDIPHPELTLILEEANACGVWTLSPSSTLTAGMQYARHGNGLANFAFADMHMQSLNSADANAMLQANKILLNPALTPGH